jgi:hypothetical protein
MFHVYILESKNTQGRSCCVLKHAKCVVMNMFPSTLSTDFSLYLTKLKHWTPHRTSMSYNVIACFTCREGGYGVWTGERDVGALI